MTVFYQRRGTGKSTQIVQLSAATGWPIAARSKDHIEHLKFIAKQELHIEIPEPFLATPDACTKAGNYLVDDAAILLQKILGGNIKAITISDEDDERFKFYGWEE